MPCKIPKLKKTGHICNNCKQRFNTCVMAIPTSKHKNPGCCCTCLSNAKGGREYYYCIPCTTKLNIPS